jgi:beta-aspartyl-peptidase (threonine type)
MIFLVTEMSNNNSGTSIIVHGGAWAIPDDARAGCLAGCERAARAGSLVLSRGGSAVEAVEVAVKILEDDQNFGAGYGSSLTTEGHVEMDSMIMDGSKLGLGAVASVRRVKNPITLARAVMEKTRHTMLVGEGATRFAQQVGVQMVEKDEDMVSPMAVEEWKSFKARGEGALRGFFHGEGHDTVGCIAIDQRGRIAVGSSTGGVPFKMPGRVGDSPLIGCGGFADENSGISTTGHGESIMRVVLAKEVASLIDSGLHPNEACKRALQTMKRKVNGLGGAISLDKAGRIGFAFTTPRMAYAFVEHGGKLVSGIDPAGPKTSKL